MYALFGDGAFSRVRVRVAGAETLLYLSPRAVLTHLPLTLSIQPRPSPIPTPIRSQPLLTDAPSPPVTAPLESLHQPVLIKVPRPRDFPSQFPSWPPSTPHFFRLACFTSIRLSRLPPSLPIPARPVARPHPWQTTRPPPLRPHSRLLTPCRRSPRRSPRSRLSGRQDPTPGPAYAGESRRSPAKRHRCP